MVMVLPFALALLAAALAIAGRRIASLWAWLAFMAVLVAWFAFHLTSSLDIVL